MPTSIELSRESALSLLKEELMPALTERFGDSVTPSLEDGRSYSVDGSTSGSVQPILGKFGGMMHEPLSARNTQVPYTNWFEVGLARDPKIGIVAVNMRKKFATAWEGLAKDIHDTEVRRLLGRTYVTLAIAHSIEPSSLRMAIAYPQYVQNKATKT